jgi:CRISPR-associated protein (TIGR03984 family)
MTPGGVAMGAVFLAFEPVALPAGDLRAALQACWKGSDAWMVGHAFDGVVWGALRGGKLVTPPDDLQPPALRAETLMDLVLFDGSVELRVWRAGGSLEACAVREAAAGERFEATQERLYPILGARDTGMRRGAFVELCGPAGQRHTPPGDTVRPERLRVRHYLRADEETGLLAMTEHRLLGLEEEDWAR